MAPRLWIRLVAHPSEPMNSLPDWHSEPLRAPIGNGELLAVPALGQAAQVLEINASRLVQAAHIGLPGKSLGELRSETRQAALAAARDYTAELGGSPEQSLTDGSGDLPLIVTGHQPALVHPGVWAKHFAVSGLSQCCGGLGLNVVVDNDLLATTSLAVPRGPRSRPRYEAVPFLEPQSPRPWEEAVVDNARPFETFGQRVSAAIREDWGIEPLLANSWADAVATREQTPWLRDCFTAMRHRQERRWGLSNLEVPLSRLEESVPFRWFLAHLLAEASRFREIHNATLIEYRQRHHVRSVSHPVADLAERDDWVETPFWIWRGGETQRGRLFVRSQARGIELARNAEPVGTLPGPGDDARPAIAELERLSAAGWKIRTRALTTTLFLRLCLADLFVHGIGGAKYDEMTDELMRRFLGIEPPEFLTVTATLHLPIAPFPDPRGEIAALLRQQRDLQFNADRLPLNGESGANGVPITATAQWRQLSADHRTLVEEYWATKPSGLPHHERRRLQPVRRGLHQRLREVESGLARLAEPLQGVFSTRLAELHQRLDANRLLQSREFAWCLFPEPPLRQLLERIRSDC